MLSRYEGEYPVMIVNGSSIAITFETVCYEIYKDDGETSSIGSYYMIYINDDIFDMDVKCGCETIYLVGDRIYEIYLGRVNIIPDDELPGCIRSPHKVNYINIKPLQCYVNGKLIRFEDEYLGVCGYEFKNIIIESDTYNTNIDYTSVIIPLKFVNGNLKLLVLSARAERGYYKLEL